MKFLNLLLVVFLVGFITSCSSDGDCTASDWIGTYDLDPASEDCSDPNVSLSDFIVISAGATEGSIDFDGIEVEVNGCSLTYTDPFFGISGDADLDGDQITTSVLGCTGTFIRR
ncbi:MAG: hypothetical protein HKN09_13595 [Saprospiraceae bacterium]|nr:hypothetical protein [Saprospiraceae bacterium]